MHDIYFAILPRSAKSRLREVSLQLSYLSAFSLIKRFFRDALNRLICLMLLQGFILSENNWNISKIIVLHKKSIDTEKFLCYYNIKKHNKNQRGIIMKLLSAITTAAVALSAAEAFLPVNFVSYSADTAQHNGMVFELRENSENELILTEYTDAKGAVAIPEKIGDYTITAIGDKVFNGNTAISSVELPDSINYFGGEVFRDSSVSAVNIPKSLRIIPSYTFDNCQELETVEFHDDIFIISNTAFQKTNITLPDLLFERVSGSTIKNSYTTVDFPHDNWSYSVSTDKNSNELYVYVNQYIGTNPNVVFSNSLFGETVDGIDRAFNFNGKSIASVTFPENYKEINVDFSNHFELKKVDFLSPEIDLNNTSFSNTSIEEISLPVNEIKAGIFNGCTELKIIEFNGSGVLDIQNTAFKSFTSINSVTFSENYEEINIGRNAFDNTGISEIIIPSYCNIEFASFRNCRKLKSVEIENGNVATNAFLDCTSLQSAEFKGDVSIDCNAFLDCSALQNITIDISKDYASEAFTNCISLTQINGMNAFENGEFAPEYKDFIYRNFYAVNDVGFINQYVMHNVKEIVRDNITDDMSETQKVKVLHDWVCNNTEYTTGDTDLLQYHTDASVLMIDSVVCEGYAKMCNLLYHEAGIETYYVNNPDHAWNIVRIGGHYFHADSTWDDGDKINRDNFLKSDQQFIAHGGSHAIWQVSTPSSLHTFQKEETPECKYQIGDTNTDGTMSVADIVKMNRYLLGAEPIVQDDHILYDTDHNSTIDVFDMIYMRKLILNMG